MTRNLGNHKNVSNDLNRQNTSNYTNVDDVYYTLIKYLKLNQRYFAPGVWFNGTKPQASECYCCNVLSPNVYT